MNETPWMGPQRELFPPDGPASLLTEERRATLIPLLSIIVAAATVPGTAATDRRAPQGSRDDR